MITAALDDARGQMRARTRRQHVLLHRTLLPGGPGRHWRRRQRRRRTRVRVRRAWGGRRLGRGRSTAGVGVQVHRVIAHHDGGAEGHLDGFVPKEDVAGDGAIGAHVFDEPGRRVALHHRVLATHQIAIESQITLRVPPDGDGHPHGNQLRALHSLVVLDHDLDVHEGGRWAPTSPTAEPWGTRPRRQFRRNTPCRWSWRF